MTTGFVDGVEAQSESLGFEPAVAWVPHPIQNRTPAELDALADQTFAKVMALLTDPSPQILPDRARLARSDA